MTQTWIIASCRIPLSGEKLVIMMPRSACGVPDVVVHMGRAGDGELLVVGLWYLILLTEMSLPMSKRRLILESVLGNGW